MAKSIEEYRWEIREAMKAEVEGRKSRSKDSGCRDVNDDCVSSENPYAKTYELYKKLHAGELKESIRLQLCEQVGIKPRSASNLNWLWIIVVIWLILYTCEAPLTSEEKEIESDTYILR